SSPITPSVKLPPPPRFGGLDPMRQSISVSPLPRGPDMELTSGQKRRLKYARASEIWKTQKNRSEERHDCDRDRIRQREGDSGSEFGLYVRLRQWLRNRGAAGSPAGWAQLPPKMSLWTLRRAAQRITLHGAPDGE